jgi:hypothetical protein
MQLHFYATKDDLLPLVAIVERKVALDYVLTGNFLTDAVVQYGSIQDIPNLGHATRESASGNAQFLVVMKGHRVNVRTLPGINGKTRYLIDQLANQSSLMFQPGGFWGDDILLHGRVGTVHTDGISKELMKRFSGAIRKSFCRIKAFWVGPEAERLLDAGMRLTIAEQSPPEFNLTRK